jgi:2-polyprenyl-6-methoxyphenol hydroxylase-like FAD-dependent oxidoreductase
VTFQHPVMQETLLAEAAEVANVWRGATVTSVEPGAMPVATIAVDGGARQVRARLVVGADGRDSTLAGMLGFERRRDPEELITSGMLIECDGLPPESVHVHRDPNGGRMAILLSPAAGLQRVYLIYGRDALPRRLSGARDLGEALRHLGEIGVPDDHVAGARLRGPYASFDGAHRWITTPHRDGVVLIGDAAGVSDPAWGCGLSRTMRDVRLLRDALLADDDWGTAAHAYAVEHDDAFHRLRRLERLYAELFMATGEEADGVRGRLGPVLAEHPDSTIALGGPEMHFEHLAASLGEQARARLVRDHVL